MHSERLGPIPPEAWTEEQRCYAQEIIDGPRGELISPFVPLLRSPELMAHVGRLGEYLRYCSAIYDFCDELHRNRSVSDPTWMRSVEQFGEQMLSISSASTVTTRSSRCS